MSSSDPIVSTDTGVSDPTLGFGLTGISDWSTEMPFLDLVKTMRPWIGHTSTVWSAMTTEQLTSGGYLDANGWPTTIPTGLTSVGTVWDWGSSATDPAAAASRMGIYVLTYEGEGTLKLGGDVKILSTEPGRIVLQNMTGSTMLMDITATDPNHTGNYLHNISVVPQKYEALHDAGEIFNPAWLAIVQDARELRFMDWMDTNGVTQASWGDRPEVGDATWASKGVPLEVMVQLANQTGTEPWFNIPMGADEAYIRNFATYVRDHLNPDLKVHVEYSNETWNWAFAQTQWLGTQAKTVWASTDGAAWLDYSAMLATKSALIWDNVFGAAADARVDNVMGTQTANAWIGDHLLTAPLWKTMDPTGYVAPSSVFDSLAVTTYFGGATMADATLRNDLLTALKTTGVDATAWLAAKLMDPNYSQSIPQITAWWNANKAVADKYGLDLVAYEGGQHVLQSFALTGITAEDQATLTTFLSGFVRTQAMADLYHTLWTAWAAVSNGPFMQFGDVASASKYGAWGIFSALGDHNARADLLMDLNAHSTAWFGTGGGAQYQQGVILVAPDAGGTLTGTDKDDFLIGGKGNDVIIAGKGHDAISGGLGQDVLMLAGAAGDYQIVAEGTGYRLVGAGIAHYLRGIENFHFADGSTLTLANMLGLVPTSGQTLTGTAGDDTVLGGAGDDTIIASTGHDTIIGGTGTDTLVLGGQAGSFTLAAESTGYRLSGANVSDYLQGVEKFSFADNVTLTLDDMLRLTSTTGQALAGTAGDDVLAATAGADTITASAGRDILIGGAGSDTLVLGGQASSFALVTEGSGYRLTGATVSDYLQGIEKFSFADNVALTIDDMLRLTSTAGQVLAGTAGNDTLAATAGADRITASTGQDAIIGGAGSDILVLGGQASGFALAAEGNGHRLTGANISDYLQGVEKFGFSDNVALTLNDMLRLTSATGQAFAGTAGDDVLAATAGADTITASAGHDTIIGGAGDDTLVLGGQASSFTLAAEGSGYRLTGTNISDYLQGVDKFSFDGGVTLSADQLLSQIHLDPNPLYVAARGVRADASAVGRVQINDTTDTGVTIRGIDPLSDLGKQLGLDVNSDLANYVIAGNNAKATFGKSMVQQNYWSLEENQASEKKITDLSSDALTTALKLGTVVTSVHSISGTSGNDLFLGGGQTNVFDGGAGNDILYGHKGADVLIGGTGDDILYGGWGMDTMSGGAGRDRFCLGNYAGQDRIIDFTQDDVLDLSARSITSHDALMAMVSQDAAGNLVIGDSASAVTLVGLHTSDMSWLNILL